MPFPLRFAVRFMEDERFDLIVLGKDRGQTSRTG